MENILGLGFEEYEITENSKSYAKSFTISATIEGITTELVIDIVDETSLPLSARIYHPITWGRTLKYGKNGISLRKVKYPAKYSKIPSLKYIENMLSQQKDIGCTHYLPSLQGEKEKTLYLSYIKCKIENLEKEGYQLLKS